MITQPPDTWVQMRAIKFATLCNNKYLLFSKVGRSIQKREKDGKCFNPFYKVNKNFYIKHLENIVPTNITYEYRCSTFQQNICKPNPAEYLKDSISWPSTVNAGSTRMIQY